MDVIYERCCGLGIHKRTVVACLIVPAPGGPPRKEVRTFGTMTEDILALGDWLAAAGCRHVAMESTGVLWKPIYNLLEGAFELRLANARHIKCGFRANPISRFGVNRSAVSVFPITP
jgi:transposase